MGYMFVPELLSIQATPSAKHNPEDRLKRDEI
jgi:hypothetical protein